MTALLAFFRDERGGPGAEMALVLPMLIALLFGGMEGGNFFWREHQVVKAAREGARFAGRLPFAEFDCAAGTISQEVIDQVTAVAAANLVGDAAVSVAVVGCATDSQYGIYATQPDGAPIVSVGVQMPYQALMATMIFDDAITLNASAQTAVMGL